MRRITKIAITAAAWLALCHGMKSVNISRNRSIYLSGQDVYQTNEDFKRDLEIEKGKLGITDEIEYLFGNGIIGRCVKKDDRFTLMFDPRYVNRKVLRHELYHVKHWHKHLVSDIITMGQYDEWCATSYSIRE